MALSVLDNSYLSIHSFSSSSIQRGEQMEHSVLLFGWGSKPSITFSNPPPSPTPLPPENWRQVSIWSQILLPTQDLSLLAPGSLNYFLKLWSLWWSTQLSVPLVTNVFYGFHSQLQYIFMSGASQRERSRDNLLVLLFQAGTSPIFYKLKSFASCSHIFCIKCSKTSGLSLQPDGNRTCPACHADLPNPDDAVVVDLNPTEDYKSSVLVGLHPTAIMECAARALAFWFYQCSQEMYPNGRPTLIRVLKG